jgi:hypothetical protein
VTSSDLIERLIVAVIDNNDEDKGRQLLKREKVLDFGQKIYPN